MNKSNKIQLDQINRESYMSDFLRFAARTTLLKDSIISARPDRSYWDLVDFVDEFSYELPFRWKIVLCEEAKRSSYLDELLTKVARDRSSDHLDPPHEYIHLGRVEHRGAFYLWNVIDTNGEIVVLISHDGGG